MKTLNNDFNSKISKINMLSLETIVMERSQRRSKNPKSWKRNIIKTARQSGKQYTDRNGTLRIARAVKPGCGTNCEHKCHEKFGMESRCLINEAFWKLTDNDKPYYYNKTEKSTN